MLISFVLSAVVELSDPEESLACYFGRIALTAKQNKKRPWKEEAAAKATID